MSRLYWLCNFLIAGLVTSVITHQNVRSWAGGVTGAETARSAPVPAATPAAPSLPVVITPGARSDQEAAIAWRGRNGHFVFETVANGMRLPMMFDTGATYTSLRAEDAARIGINVNTLNYSRNANTVNGVTQMAPVTIDTLTVGTITRRNVAAFVAQPGKLNVNLLGQSFMERIAGFSVEGDQLVLKGGG